MKRLPLFLAAVLVLSSLCGARILAQTASGEIRFEGRISEIRTHEEPRGIQLQTPDPIPLAGDAAILDEQGQALSLSALSDRVFDARDQIRVRITLDDQKEIKSLTVLGLNEIGRAHV